MTKPQIPAGLNDDQLAEIDQMLDDMRERAEEIPQWEFVDGVLTGVNAHRAGRRLAVMRESGQPGIERIKG